jgi:hypothetical protein
MTEFENIVFDRLGKMPDQCSQEEIRALAAQMDAEGRAHEQHAAELLQFKAKRAAGEPGEQTAGADAT